MITIDVLVKQIVGLREPDLQRWIELAYVRPQGSSGHWFFREIDVARVHLIMTLQSDLQIGEDALPTILSLLDQLYDARRQLRRLADAIEIAPNDVRGRVLGAAFGGGEPTPIPPRPLDDAFRP